MSASLKREILEQVFSPSAPVTSQDLFAGRMDELRRAVDAINQVGQHFAVYGDRGVGKTSFANILCTRLENLFAVKVTCARDDSFKRLWRKALSQIKFQRDRLGAGFIPERVAEFEQLDLFMPAGDDISNSELMSTLSLVSNNLLFLFDEYDSVKCDDVKQKFADFIKFLSDNSKRVTVGLVGIAEDVPELIGSHPSIERCLKQIKMPAMSSSELAEIIDRAAAKLEIAFSLDVRQKIVYFSSGYPHFTHLLGKFSAANALDRGAVVVSSVDYKDALDGALADTSQSIQHAYHLATLDSKQKKSRFTSVLHACAVCAEDEFQSFSSSDVVLQMNRARKTNLKAQNINYNLQKLCEMERGSVLMKVGGSTNLRYRFRNPLLKAYIRMKMEKSEGNQAGLLV